MRAVQVVRLAGPSAVELRDVPEPRPRGDQVLVDVRAAGVSFPDVLQTRGLYQHRPELPFTLGAEVAGVVREAPARSTVAPGDRVVAFTGIGAFAEAVAVPADHVLPLPDGLPFGAAAGLPLNYLTAQFALQERGHLRGGQTVLVCTGPPGASAAPASSWPRCSAPGSSPWCPRRPSTRSRWSPGRTPRSGCAGSARRCAS